MMSHTLSTRHRLPGLLAGTLAALTVLPVAAAPADWPQWRGPHRTGISSERGWSAEGKPESVWSASVGLGYSSVAVAGGRLYTMGHDMEAGLDTVFCLDADTGKKIWTHSYPALVWARAHGGGTLTTPSIDGDVVYTLNREGSFFCFDAAGGKVIWSRKVTDEFGVTPPTWGFSASPLVLDDMLVLNVGRTIAMKRRTGETIWQTRDTGHAYSTPAEMSVDGRACLAVLNGEGLAVFEKATGKELGFLEWKTKYDINAATPVIVGNKIFISSGYGHGCALVEPTSEGLRIVWQNKNMRNKMSGCVLYQDHLYGFDDTMLKCLDLEGNEKWRLRGIGMGALMAADGRLIALSEDGELIIAEAKPDAYTELSRAKCLEGGVNWTMPVLVDGRIYCRNSKGSLVCRDHRGAASGANESGASEE
jgi:outer membrane protein assembly factor BamB